MLRLTAPDREGGKRNPRPTLQTGQALVRSMASPISLDFLLNLPRASPDFSAATKSAKVPQSSPAWGHDGQAIESPGSGVGLALPDMAWISISLVPE